MNKIKLSPSSLNLFLECPKCFWLEQNKKIHRPKGPFPSLPGGIDAVLKKYFDKFREKNDLPPEIKGQVKGKLFDDWELMKKWRNNLQGIRWHDSQIDADLMGALDECLVDKDYFIPLDYKTRGWLAKENSHIYYQNQLNVYTLLLEKNGFPYKNLAYILFYSPKEVKNFGDILFDVELREIKTDPQEAYRVFKNAVDILRNPQPKSHSECKFCSWGNDFLDFE